MGKKAAKPITYEQACRQMPDVLEKLSEARSDFTQKHEAYADAHAEMAAAQRTLASIHKRLSKLQEVVDTGEGRGKALENREVERPDMTREEFYHELEQAMAGAEPSQVAYTTEQKQERLGPGKVRAIRDMLLYIGGFAYFRNRTEAQEIAAARFLNAYQGAQIGGARATDYSQPLVDTSGPVQDGVLVAHEDHVRRYRDAVQFLGMIRSGLLEKVVVRLQTCNQIAEERAGHEVAGRPVAEVADEVRGILDDLADHWGISGKSASRARAQQWNDGTETHYSGEVLKRPGVSETV